MIKGKASLEATKAFATRHAQNRLDFYTLGDEYCISSLGFGSYVGEPYREQNYQFGYVDSMVAAVKCGANLIDTAINYRYQQSEREIGTAIKKLVGDGHAKREELVICSKGGFLPLDYPFPDNPYQWIKENIINSGLAKDSDIALDQHCMTPEYIEWSLEKTLENLGLESIDIYYLHNPETQLGFVEKEQFYENTKAVFATLEKARGTGKIGYYGVAVWNAFLYEPENMEYISIKKLHDIAKEVGGEQNGFKFVQMPYNLAKPHAYTYQNQELDGLHYTAIQCAKKLGLSVITSSALLQMNIFKRPFSDGFRTLINLEYASDVQRALHFARCAAGVSASLVGTCIAEHAIHDMDIAKFARTPRVDYEKIFKL
jgi:aryl-alcohol dehydrogenase-like predicted oxidoreductase